MHGRWSVGAAARIVPILPGSAATRNLPFPHAANIRNTLTREGSFPTRDAESRELPSHVSYGSFGLQSSARADATAWPAASG